MRVEGPSPFLWVDRQPDAQRAQLYDRLKRGEVLVQRLQTREGNAEIKITDGLIHHWVGTVFMPGATMDASWRSSRTTATTPSTSRRRSSDPA